MNRQQFLKLLGISLLDTVKEASSPLVEEKMVQVHHIIDQFQEITYTPFPSSTKGVQIEMMNEKSVLKLGGQFYLNHCPVCESMLHPIKEKEMKCFSCDTSFVEKENKIEKLQLLHTRETNGVIFVGIPKK